ncbi:MAG: TlpA family protein disulfide reductase [Anaerolineae bacterium]|nr:TlpA family protein disulfide reductase [Anaerolineae bacterium]
MAFILWNDGRGANEATPLARQYPTPAPIDVTFAPTATVVPILDAPAPDLPLQTAEGETFTLADFAPQIVILNFWASWCPPCVEEMPLLRDFQAANPEVRVVAVTNPNDGQTPASIQAFIAENDLGSLAYGYDAENRLQSWMRAFNLPTTYIIDQAGVVRFRQIGVVTEDDLAYYLDELRP